MSPEPRAEYDRRRGKCSCGYTNRCFGRAGKIPTGWAWSFEPKLDGFRAIVSNMSRLLPELDSLPSDVILDGS